MFYILKKLSSLKSLLSDMYFTYITYSASQWASQRRYKYYKKRLAYCGENVNFDVGVSISGAEYIYIGDGTHIDKNCILVGAPSDLDLSYRYVKNRTNPEFEFKPGEIHIGKECHISQNTMIYGYGGVDIGDNSTLSVGTKVYSLTSMAYNPFDRSEVVSIVPYSGKSPTLMGPVVMKKNSWCGIDCIVSPGVTLGENTFAKSQSVINSSFGENSYIGGNPAIYLRKRFDDKEDCKKNLDD